MNDPLKEFVVWEIFYGIWMNVVGPGIQFDFVVGKVFGANLVKDTRDSVWTCGRIWIEFPNCLRILGGIKPDVVQNNLIWLSRNEWSLERICIFERFEFDLIEICRVDDPWENLEWFCTIFIVNVQRKLKGILKSRLIYSHMVFKD